MSLADECAAPGHPSDQQLPSCCRVTLESSSTTPLVTSTRTASTSCSCDTIQTDDLPISSRRAFVQPVPSRPVLAAHVSRLVHLCVPDLPSYGRGMTKGMTSLATAEPPGGGQPRKVAARRDRNRKQGDSSRAGQRQTRRWVSAAAVMPGRSRPAIRAGGQEGRRWLTEGTRQRGLGRQRPLRRYSHPEQVVGPEAATTRLPLVTGGNLRPPPGPTRPTRVPGSVARSGQGCDHRWPTADTVSARAKDQGSQ